MDHIFLGVGGGGGHPVSPLLFLGNHCRQVMYDVKKLFIIAYNAFCEEELLGDIILCNPQSNM
jgi:hypothetical protein